MVFFFRLFSVFLLNCKSICPNKSNSFPNTILYALNKRFLPNWHSFNTMQLLIYCHFSTEHIFIRERERVRTIEKMHSCQCVNIINCSPTAMYSTFSLTHSAKSWLGHTLPYTRMTMSMCKVQKFSHKLFRMHHFLVILYMLVNATISEELEILSNNSQCTIYFNILHWFSIKSDGRTSAVQQRVCVCW